MNTDISTKIVKRVAIFGITGILGLGILFGSWYTVDQGYRGVILRNGAVVGVAEPGLGFKIPFIDSVYEIAVQEKVIQYAGGGPDGAGLSTYSADQQPANIRIAVNYRIPPDRVSEVYAEYGGEEGLVSRALDPRVYRALKDTFGKFNAVTAIQDRTRLNLEVQETLVKLLGNAPIVISGVAIQNIDFSEAYEQSIEQRMQAEVEVQKLRQNAEREKVQAQITVTKAQAQADAVRAEAQAQADAITLKGNAEASAIRAKGDALKDNPGLIGLVTAEKWNGTLPQTMVPGAAVPFVSVGR
jgi:regulator of protease activity HflC (stomatin/prohibitin superfamily)